MPNLWRNDIKQDEKRFILVFLFQWPFATLMKEGKDFSIINPTSLMETVINLRAWVARMMMMGVFITGNSLFSMYFSMMVRDNKAKMSKSKGNVMDPLVLVDKYGAMLCVPLIFCYQRRETIFVREKVKGAKLCNKIWNIGSYIEMNK
jgi:valyl-tRNA synthetase